MDENITLSDEIVDESTAKKPKKESAENETVSWMQVIIVSVIIVILLFTFVARNVNVYGESMTPYLNDKDRIILSIYNKDYKYGDIVAIRRKEAQPLIKRVIATEGQTVNIDYEVGTVTVDGKVLDEQYIREYTQRDLGLELPIIVPKGHIFVMGDNRNHSDDSRNPTIGTIDTRYVFGKAVFRVFPFRSFGGLSIDKAVEFGEKYHEQFGPITSKPKPTEDEDIDL